MVGAHIPALGRLIGSGRLGVPVFCRLVVPLPEGGDMCSEVARSLAFLVPLFPGGPSRLFARSDGAERGGHAVLQLDTGGALLAIAAPGTRGCVLTVLGNHGAAYGDGTAPIDWDTAPEPDVGLTARLVAAIRASVERGAAVPFAEGDANG